MLKLTAKEIKNTIFVVISYVSEETLLPHENINAVTRKTSEVLVFTVVFTTCQSLTCLSGCSDTPEKINIPWCFLNNGIIGSNVLAVKSQGQDIERTHFILFQMGFTFDRSLSFAHLIDDMVHKGSRLIEAVRIIAATNFPQRTLFLLMHSTVGQWDWSINLSNSLLTKLEGVQNEAMRVVLGCTRDTPVMAMRYLTC